MLQATTAFPLPTVTSHTSVSVPAQQPPRQSTHLLPSVLAATLGPAQDSGDGAVRSSMSGANQPAAPILGSQASTSSPVEPQLAPADATNFPVQVPLGSSGVATKTLTPP
jgi:hypothetical protein